MTDISISLKTVKVTRDGHDILYDISVDISNQKGGMIGLIGPNGAGKSTLLSLIAGLLPCEQGKLEICNDGRNVTDLSTGERAQLISYLPQLRPVHWAMRVDNIVRLGRYAYGGSLSQSRAIDARDNEAVDLAMRLAGVSDFRDRFMTKLSGGEQSRVHLARALCAQTPILLADEPTNALDPEHQFSLMKTLSDYASDGRLVVTALHDLSLATRFCDQLLILNAGNLIAYGAPGEVLSPECLREVFNVSGTWVKGAHTEDLTTLTLAPLMPDNKTL